MELEEPGLYGSIVAEDGREWIRWSVTDRAGRDWVRPDPDGRTHYLRWDQLSVVRVVNRGAPQ